MLIRFGGVRFVDDTDLPASSTRTLSSVGAPRVTGVSSSGAGMMSAMAPPLIVAFVGGAAGRWHVERMGAVAGEGMPLVAGLDVVEGTVADGGVAAGRTSRWVLRGTTSNERYVERPERAALVARQPPLGRPEATCAALIPIKKSPAWWDLTQDARREIFEDRSRHIATGLEYLPAVARRLHHSREMGEEFDFLTWFEFAPAETDAFEQLVGRLRATEEWSYVDREVDIRLAR